jgi:hypothetical protein
MVLFIKCIRIINEFIKNIQGIDDGSPTSNFLKAAENNVIFGNTPETPQKNTF